MNAVLLEGRNSLSIGDKVFGLLSFRNLDKYVPFLGTVVKISNDGKQATIRRDDGISGSGETLQGSGGFCGWLAMYNDNTGCWGSDAKSGFLYKLDISDLTSMVNKATDELLDKMEESFKKSGGKQRYYDFIKSRNRFGLMVKHKIVKLKTEADSCAIVERVKKMGVSGKKAPSEIPLKADSLSPMVIFENQNIPFSIVFRLDNSNVTFTKMGKEYPFVSLFKEGLNKRCDKKLLGMDIEYYVGGSNFGSVANALKGTGKFDCSTDHNGEVLEHRPKATNNPEEIAKEIKEYYDEIDKVIKAYPSGNGGKPKISWDRFYVGAHLHLHLFENPERVLGLLDLFAVWHNLLNEKLWLKRIAGNYGMPFNRDYRVRVSDWRCQRKNHHCIEYRAFNSGTPNQIKALMLGARNIIRMRELIAPKDLYARASEHFTTVYSKIRNGETPSFGYLKGDGKKAIEFLEDNKIIRL